MVAAVANVNAAFLISEASCSLNFNRQPGNSFPDRRWRKGFCENLMSVDDRENRTHAPGDYRKRRAREKEKRVSFLGVRQRAASAAASGLIALLESECGGPASVDGWQGAGDD